MNIDEISAEVLGLKPHDRATLAEVIWESLEAPFKLPKDISDDEAIILSKIRDREIESGKVTPISHNELMNKLRNEN